MKPSTLWYFLQHLLPWNVAKLNHLLLILLDISFQEIYIIFNSHPNHFKRLSKGHTSMGRSAKPKIGPFRHLNLIFLFLSLLLAAVITLLLSRSMNPFQFKILEKQPLSSPHYLIYHDFEKDGFSEGLNAVNQAARSFITVTNFSQGTIDQTNYSEHTRSEWLFFADYNEDDYDEIFAFTQNSDSLFLYIHDLRSKKTLLKRHFLLNARQPKSQNTWDPVVLAGGLLEIDGRKGKELVFAVAAGQALSPRSVYVFDIQERRIVKRFETDANFRGIVLYDLTGDGKDEIIVFSRATGNIHYPARYNDDRCWLFVLDQHLSPILEPLSFGEYPSVMNCSPIEMENERFLLLSYRYGGEKELPSFLCLIDANGKIHPRKNYGMPRALTVPLIDQDMEPPVMYCALRTSELIKMNEQLKIIRQKTTEFPRITPAYIKDFDAEGSKEILCTSNDFMLMFNQELELLAAFRVPSVPSLGRVHEIPWWDTITFRETGPGKPIEMAVQFGEQVYRFAFEKNALYPFLSVLSIGLAGFIFLFLIGGHRFSSLVYTYLSYFRFALSKSPQGILILNRTGHIYYLNNRVQPLLDLKNPIFKKQHFTGALKENPQLIELIQKSMASGKSVKEKISFVKANYQFEGEIRVTPFVSPLK
ncbi:MAG: hypothetical protein ACE5HO_13635, partial [bacterium]